MKYGNLAAAAALVASAVGSPQPQDATVTATPSETGPMSSEYSSWFASFASEHSSAASRFSIWTSEHPDGSFPTMFPGDDFDEFTSDFDDLTSAFSSVWSELPTAKPAFPYDHGPFGEDHDGMGPFSHGDWTRGPWTEWWGSVSASGGCPGADWPGWTAGPWSTKADWTSWSGCTASTTASSVISTTLSGTPTETTSFGVEVAAASAAPATTTPAEEVGAAPKQQIALGGALGAFLGAVALL